MKTIGSSANNESLEGGEVPQARRTSLHIGELLLKNRTSGLTLSTDGAVTDSSSSRNASLRTTHEADMLTMADSNMQPVHYFSDSLKIYCKNNSDSEIHDWLETLSTEDLLKLKYQIEVLVSPIPLGISSHEGFDLVHLAFAAESQKRRKRIVNLSWEEREIVLMGISQRINVEIEKRCVRIENIVAEAEILFGSAEKARRWMTQNNAALCDTPMSMLNTEEGANEVRKALASISYGGAI